MGLKKLFLLKVDRITMKFGNHCSTLYFQYIFFDSLQFEADNSVEIGS